MKHWGIIAIGSLALGFVLGLQFVHWPHAQEVQEVEEEETPTKVTEAEIDLYIAVYTAMQADHDLTIEAALAPRNVSLEKFREIERRLQHEQHLVERVRLALLNQAKSISTWGQPTPRLADQPGAEAAVTPAAPTDQPRPD